MRPRTIFICVFFMTVCRQTQARAIDEDQYRHKRAVSLAKKGFSAFRRLTKGTTEIAPYNRWKRLEKPGTLDSALEDFHAVNPTGVRKFFFSNGEYMYEAKAGDRKLFFLNADKLENGNPTIMIYDTKKHLEPGYKIIYNEDQYRHKRAVSLAKKGFSAYRRLIKGTTEIAPYNRWKRLEKPGTLDSALEDFHAVNPTGVRQFFFSNGDYMYEAKAGDRKLFFLNADKLEHGNPTIMIYDTKKHLEPGYKIIYSKESLKAN